MARLRAASSAGKGCPGSRARDCAHPEQASCHQAKQLCCTPASCGMPTMACVATTAKYGLLRELSPGPLAPEARIMPLDQAAMSGCLRPTRIHQSSRSNQTFNLPSRAVSLKFEVRPQSRATGACLRRGRWESSSWQAAHTCSKSFVVPWAKWLRREACW